MGRPLVRRRRPVVDEVGKERARREARALAGYAIRLDVEGVGATFKGRPDDSLTESELRTIARKIGAKGPGHLLRQALDEAGR